MKIDLNYPQYVQSIHVDDAETTDALCRLVGGNPNNGDELQDLLYFVYDQWAYQSEDKCGDCMTSYAVMNGWEWVGCDDAGLDLLLLTLAYRDNGGLEVDGWTDAADRLVALEMGIAWLLEKTNSQFLVKLRS